MKVRLCFNKRIRLNKLVLGLLVSLIVLHLCGLDTYLYQDNYFVDFTYPLQVNLTKLMIQLRSGEMPDVAPNNHFPYSLLLDSPQTCRDTPRLDLLIVVKSLITNYENRRAIRDTWLSDISNLAGGRSDQMFPHRVVRHVFLVARSDKYDLVSLRREQQEHGDLVQGDFLDEYYNNTLKTIMGFQWVKRRCPNADFVLFADDDYYVSPANVLRLIAAPDRYPKLGEETIGSVDESIQRRADRRNGINAPGDNLRHSADVKSVNDGGDDGSTSNGRQRRSSRSQWYTGFLFFVLPVRIPFHKFYVSLAEYPYNIFPPFINGGAYVISAETLASFYYATMYTVPFRLDDIYIGILAKKVGVEPEHNRYFFPYLVPYSDAMYKNLIASHGYRDPRLLRDVWLRKKQADIIATRGGG